jgi:hypothetical protein
MRPLLALSMTVLFGQVAPGQSPRVGDRHPDFTLPAIEDGTPKSLTDYRGRKVLLIQFASW